MKITAAAGRRAVVYDPNKEDSSEDKLDRSKGLHVMRHSFHKA